MNSAYASLLRKFAVGATSDGYVNVSSFGKNGESITKTVTKDEARELAIQLLKAAR